MVHKTDLFYKGGKWEARNGRLIAMGTKQECQLAALEHDCPSIHGAVAGIIEAADIIPFDGDLPPSGKAIKERAIRAGFILRDGLLQPPRPFEKQMVGEVAWCKSQYGGSDDGYAITRRGDDIWCQCRDWYNAPRLGCSWKGQIACKHILAYIIQGKLQAEIYDRFFEEATDDNF